MSGLDLIPFFIIGYAMGNPKGFGVMIHKYTGSFIGLLGIYTLVLLWGVYIIINKVLGMN